MVQYSKCQYGPYYWVSFHIVKARPLHSIPCEVLQKICQKHIFRLSSGGGGGGLSTSIIYITSSLYFHFVIKFRLLLSICGLHFWYPSKWNCFLRSCNDRMFVACLNSTEQKKGFCPSKHRKWGFDQEFGWWTFQGHNIVWRQTSLSGFPSGLILVVICLCLFCFWKPHSALFQ